MRRSVALKNKVQLGKSHKTDKGNIMSRKFSIWLTLFWIIQLQCGSDITNVGIQNYATTYMINLCSENDDSRLYGEIFTDFVILKNISRNCKTAGGNLSKEAVFFPT